MTTKTSKMNKAQEIFRSVYGDANLDNNEVRKTCIERFQKELKMQSTTASTYLAHVQKAVIQEEQDAAVEKAGKDKPVWSTFRTGRGDKAEIATLAGAFLTEKKAQEINSLLRLPEDNVVKGFIEIGQKVAVGA